MKKREYAFGAGNLHQKQKKRYGQTDRIMDGQRELWSSFATNKDKK